MKKEEKKVCMDCGCEIEGLAHEISTDEGVEHMCHQCYVDQLGDDIPMKDWAVDENY